MKRHGMSHTKIHGVWLMMRDRCNNVRSPDYHNYGGRGITIDERWNDFSNFYEDMGDKEDGMTIDRIDNDGPYSPENCRWVTRAYQNRNTRRNRMLTHNGITMCVVDWAKEIGIHKKTLMSRLNWGWSVEDALTKPVR